MGNCLGGALKAAEAVSQALSENENKPESKQHVSSSAGRRDHDDSVVYSSLPPGAEQGTVRNVYDGDTLTLTDERRVRLLGIDTPEIKEGQPYAEEAKEYTKSRCDEKDVWLTFDGDREDHYGRLLAFVWVKADGGYLCVNEGIVAAGLASVYSPDSDSKTSNYDKLVALQKSAKEEKRGKWASFRNRTVVKTKNGSAYHVRSCEHLSGVVHLEEMTESEAMDRGLHACRTCLS